MNWKKKADFHHPEDPKLYTLSAPGKMGRDYPTDNAVEFRCCPNFSGSGPKAFGGAKSWPTLNLRISFQEGEEAKREALLKELQRCIENFFHQWDNTSMPLLVALQPKAA